MAPPSPPTTRDPADWRDRLQAAWWRPECSGIARWLLPLSALHAGLLCLRHVLWKSGLKKATLQARPVVVVGNLIVGGAGKTPTTLALLVGLKRRGWHPGVVSRGYGRHADDMVEVGLDSTATDVGDEPLLIRRRSGVPVVVGRARAEAARALCRAHPEVDLIVSDDGLQHWALARDVQVVVFDHRGVGNARLLPAGPLREPMSSVPPAATWVVYNADQPSTSWPGVLASRQLSGAQTWAQWRAGAPFSSAALRDLAQRSQVQPLIAAAGTAEPERFFRMLEAADIRISRLPLPDHADLSTLPWPAETSVVLVTEKDAVKLEASNATSVWVIGLDFQLPDAWLDDIDGHLRRLQRLTTTPPWTHA